MEGSVSASSFSANLGFLWTDRPLPEAIAAAAGAGFSTIEMHQPYAYEASEIASVIADHGLRVTSLNTGVGNADAGELGLAAVPGRERDAQALIDQAIEYAAAIGCQFVSVVVGKTGRTEEAEATLRRNLADAAVKAADAGVSLLMEPLNHNIDPTLHLVRVADAAETIAAVGAPNVFIMADTFHVMTVEGSLAAIGEHLDMVGHIQISGWPDRGEPDAGIAFDRWLPELVAAGYSGVFGAEYNPRTTVDEGLGWFAAWNERSTS